MRKLKRLTRKSLDELAKVMPTISELRQQGFVGGGGSYQEYTPAQAFSMIDNGTWGGGYIAGYGYLSPDGTIASRSSYSSSNSSSSGSNHDCYSSCASGLVYENGTAVGVCSETGERQYYIEDVTVSGSMSGSIGSGSNLIPIWWYDYLSENPGASGGSGAISTFSGLCTISGHAEFDNAMTSGCEICTDDRYVPTGGGSSGGVTPTVPIDLKDGVNISDPDHFTFNTSDNQAFHDQLTTILKSNSVLGNLLSYFDKGVVHMTFNVGDVGGVAEMNPRNDESFHINFGEEHINENGWNKTIEGKDNMNYDWEKAGVKSGGESLLVTVVHEAMHANHYARFQEADRASSSTAPDYEASVKHMKDNGYSQEFIDIYYCKDDYGSWNHTDVNTLDKKMHDYMGKHNGGVIDAALDEYRNEHGN